MSDPDVGPRRSLLEGATNFRDVGGYPAHDGRVVRRGAVYRSGALHAITAADIERLRAMQVRIAIDLRAEEEQAAEPTAAPFVRVLSVPLARGEATNDLTSLSDGAAYLAARYQEILFERADCVGTIMTTLGQADCPPAVIHCAAGKDRTGVVVAVLLLALGVEEAVVLDDYELTSQYEAAHRVQELAAKLAHLPPAVAAGLLGTSRPALAAAIEELRSRHGSVDDYLVDAAGVAADDLASLRARLTA